MRKNGKKRSERYAVQSGHGARTGRDLDPDAVAAELERIERERGGIRPRDVVAAARPRASPLHPAFTWDDGQAAEQWRLFEARGLVRAVRVVSESGEDQGPAFVHVSVDDDDAEHDPRYVSVATAAGSKLLFNSAVRELTSKLAAAQRALQELHDAARRHTKRQQQIGLALGAVSRAQRALEKL